MVTDTETAGKIEARKLLMEPWRLRCRAAEVTHDAIATAYGCTRPFVVNVFAGRKSAPDGFVATMERLCKARARRTKARAS